MEVANCRVHGTTKAVPQSRFEQEERAVLLPLAARSYQSLVLIPEPLPVSERVAVPAVDVERRALTAYADLAAVV